MKVVSLADIHIKSRVSQKSCGRVKDPRFRREDVQYTPGYEPRKFFKQYTLQPGIYADDFRGLQSQIVNPINAVKPDLVVFNGDTFHLSRKEGRDVAIQEDALEAITTFIHGIDSPVLIIPGNSDIYSSNTLFTEDGDPNFPQFCGLNSHAASCFSNGNNFSTWGNSNFAVEIDGCKIIGIRSVGVSNYEEEKDKYVQFVKGQLNDFSGPVILFTHHPTFPYKFRRDAFWFDLPACMPDLNDELNAYTQRTGMPAMNVTGHLHIGHDERPKHVRHLTIEPSVCKYAGQDNHHIGTLIEIDNPLIQAPQDFVVRQIRETIAIADPVLG